MKTFLAVIGAITVLVLLSLVALFTYAAIQTY